MSALARELDRHIAGLRQLAADLNTEVTDLENDIQTEAAVGDGWSLDQTEAIAEAIREWGDNCMRSIAVAKDEVDEFRRALLDAFRSEKGW